MCFFKNIILTVNLHNGYVFSGCIKYLKSLYTPALN